jgi:putative phage-type endonuclease
MDAHELALYLMEEYVQENIEHIHKESFTQDMIENVSHMLQLQLDYVPSLHIPLCLLQGRTSFICPVQTNIFEKLNQLQQKYQPEQRTEEWYTMRHTLLTASSIYKIIGSDAKRNELICNKCGPVSTYQSTNTESPLHWGIKYEPISIEYYCYVNKTKIQAYGCIQHSEYPFLGASPDGINILETSPCYGRMLEIKNPCSREITGNPKEEYWIQCQVQMEVCDLEACDFLETSFKEYASKEEFDADGTFQKTKDEKYKGIILHFKVNNSYHYEYAPFQCTEEEYNQWEESKMIQYPEFMKTIYWRLEDEHCTIIQRNKEWFSWLLPKILDFQTIINEEKTSDIWKNRLPKKKNKLVLSEMK